MQGLPVNESMYVCPHLLSLPMPGPSKAYHHGCAEYRLVPGRDPVDHPASQRGEVIHAGDDQVNDTWEERTPPIKQHSSPGVAPMVHAGQICPRPALVLAPVVQDHCPCAAS